MSYIEQVQKFDFEEGRNCLDTVLALLDTLGVTHKRLPSLEELGDSIPSAQKLVVEYKGGGVTKPSEYSGAKPSSLLSKEGVFIVGWVDSIHSGTFLVTGGEVFYGDQLGPLKRFSSTDPSEIDSTFLEHTAHWWGWYERSRGVKAKARTPLYRVLS